MTTTERRTRKQVAHTLLPGAVVHFLDRLAFALRRLQIRLTRRLFALVGFNVAKRADYYSTLPVLEQIQATRQRWDRPSALPGVDVDVPAISTPMIRHENEAFLINRFPDYVPLQDDPNPPSALWLRRR